MLFKFHNGNNCNMPPCRIELHFYSISSLLYLQLMELEMNWR